MQGLSFCLLQDDLAVFIGIHHKGAAGCQRAVDQALGGGVLALSVTCGATSPKGRGLGKKMKFTWTAKGSHFGGAGIAQR